MDSAPIFIHSLFRSGSTYLFHVFRRSNLGYWCYQEPLHELAFFCRANPSGLNIDHGGSKRRLLRHPEINGSYFRELQETWPAWKDVITERIIYDAYFAPLNEDFGLEYWRALADKAHGRTVFQECRTSGRIGIIKKEIGGYHIYLWRNPWDQWWSYKVNSYFNCANQLIIHSYQAPAPVQNLRAALDLPSYLGEDIKGAFEFYGKRPLASEQSYQVFYMLWCLALHEGKACADILLNIDRLGNSKEYQFEMLSKLKIQSVDGIDFSDCRIPQGRYSEEEQKFFTKLESQVHEWLLEGGWSQPDIDQIHVLRQQYQPTAWNLSVDNLDPKELAEQASRARTMVRNLETSLSERVNYANAQAAQASERAILAESQAAQASERAIFAESQAAQASERAILAESQAAQASERAILAESQAAQASERAILAESQAAQASERAILAESQAAQAGEYTHALSQQLNAVLNSRSWKIFKPLREAGRFVRWFVSGSKAWLTFAAGSRPNRISRKAVGWVINKVRANPRLKELAITRLNKFPRLKQRLKKISLSQSNVIIQSHRNAKLVQPTAKLSPRARQIFSDLKSAMNKHNKEGV